MEIPRPNWFMRIMAWIYGPSDTRPIGEPRSRPVAEPANCPHCTRPLAEHTVTRVDGKGRTMCPKPAPLSAP